MDNKFFHIFEGSLRLGFTGIIKDAGIGHVLFFVGIIFIALI